MFSRKCLIFAGFIVMMAQTLFAQESQSSDTSKSNVPATSLQWSNRDMTYRGKNYDVMDSAYYPKFRRKQFKK